MQATEITRERGVATSAPETITLDARLTEASQGGISPHFQDREVLASISVDLKENYAALAIPTRTHLLEVLVAHRLLSDGEVKDLLSQGTPEEKRSFGEYVVTCLRSPEYAESFHSCWRELPREHRFEAIRTFSGEESEKCLLVAPYVNLAELTRIEHVEVGGERKPRESSVLSQYCKDITSTSRLFDLCIDNPDCVWTSDLIEGLRGICPGFILAKAGMLHERGILANEIYLKRVMLEYDDLFPNLGDVDFFATPEEQARKEEIDAIGAARIKGYGHYTELGLSLKGEYETLVATARVRRMEYVLADFPRLRPLFSSDERALQFLKDLFTSAHPVGAVFDRLGLTSQEMRHVVQSVLREQEGLIYDSQLRDAQVLASLGFGREVWTNLKNTCTDFEPVLFQNPEWVATWLGEDRTNALLEHCRNESPDTYLQHVLLTEPKLEKFLEAAEVLVGTPSRMSQNFLALWHGVGRTGASPGEVQAARARLRDLGRAALKGDPDLVCRSTLARHVLTPEERDAVMLDLIRTTNSEDTIDKLLGATRSEEVENALRERLQADQEFFEVALGSGYSYNTRYIRKILGEEEFVDMLAAAVVRRGPGILGDNSKAIRLLFESDRHFGVLLDYFREVRNAQDAPPLAEVIEELGRKGHGLKPVGRQGTILREVCRENLHALVEEHPLLLTSEDIRDALSPGQLQKLVTKEIGFLAKVDPMSLPEFERVLDQATFRHYMSRHLRGLAAFVKKDYPPTAPAGFEEVFQRLSPFEHVRQQADSQEDTGVRLLQQIANMRAFPWFERSLRKEVVRKLSEKGPSVEGFSSLSGDFLRTVGQITALQYSPVARQFHGELDALPLEARAGALRVLEMAVRYNFDEQLYREGKPNSLSGALEGIGVRAQSLLAEISELPALNPLNGAPLLAADQVGDLLVYYRYRCQTDPEHAAVFREAVSSLLEGDFAMWRAWGTKIVSESDKEQALSAMQSRDCLPKRLRLAQYDAWLEDGDERAEKFSVQRSDVVNEIGRLFEQRVAEGVLDPSLLQRSWQDIREEYTAYAAEIQALVDEKNALAAAVEEGSQSAEKLQEVRAQVERWTSDHREKLMRLRAQMYLKVVHELDPDGVVEGRLLIGEKWLPLPTVMREMQGLLEEGTQKSEGFAPILMLLRELDTMQAPRDAKGELRLAVVDRVDSHDYLRVGIDPVETCQSFQSEEGDYSRGLLSTVVDPGVRVLQLHDASERLVGRALLRLVEDEAGAPALFLEDHYGLYSLEPALFSSLQSYATEKAAKMGVPLYGCEGGYESIPGSIPKVLRVSRGRTNFIYSDNAGNGEESSNVRITSARCLFAPQQSGG